MGIFSLSVTDTQLMRTPHKVQAWSQDSELLVGLSHDELEALAESKLAPSEQALLDDLLARNKEQQLKVEEASQLDHFLKRVDHLTVLKTRARFTLNQQEAVPTGM